MVHFRRLPAAESVRVSHLATLPPDQAFQRTGSAAGFTLLSKFQARRPFGRPLNTSSLGRKTMASEPPIQNLDQIDIVGKRKSGGVDLFLVVSSRLTQSPEHQRLLLDKLGSYLEQRQSPGFINEFGESTKVRIVVQFAENPDPVIIELLKRSAEWVKSHNVDLAAKVGA